MKYSQLVTIARKIETSKFPLEKKRRELISVLPSAIWYPQEYEWQTEVLKDAHFAITMPASLFVEIKIPERAELEHQYYRALEIIGIQNG